MSSPRMPSEPPMTVDAALRLPALRRGAPEVLAGADQLHRTVRWGHSCEARHVPGLLEGEELLLMTGMGLATGAADQRAFIRDLAAHRVAALVIELGHVFRQMPAAFVQEARRLRLPLIALHHEVRFVEVTRQLHTAILSRQLTVERRIAALHDELTGMLVDGAGVPAILAVLAAAVGNPVLLERAGEVVFHAGHDAVAEDLLTQWELLRPQADAGEPVAAIGAVTAPGGRPWGRLVAVPHERALDALAIAAVERTAPLVALALLRAGEEHLLESRERGNFLHDVIAGRIAPEDVGSRAVRLGMPAAEPRLLGVVVAHGVARAGAGHDERGRSAALREVRDALRAFGIAALIGMRPGSDDVVMLAALPPAMARDVAVEHVVEVLDGVAGDLGSERARAVAAGPLAESWEAAPATLRAAAETADTMRDGPVRRWHDATSADVERLLWSLRDDERLAAFARQRLKPLVDHDRARGAALLPTLRTLCDCHWHKAHAARALAIRRQSLYARIDRLRRVLDADLDDPEVRLGLEIAVRALRAGDPAP